MPAWVAVLIAVIATTIGFAVDAGSGNKELGGVFAAMYVLGCVAAVVAVRQSGIFTAVIQPPLILFVAVPGAYFLFHGAKFTGIKDTLINCGYPLIERFPLMLFTSAGVLLIGMARWYFGTSARAVAPVADGVTETAAPTSSRFAGLAAKLTSVFAGGDADGDDVDLAGEPPKRKHGIDRPATAEKRPRTGRPAKRPAPTRSRHARPPLEDITEAPPERPRRQPTNRRPASARDFDPSGEPPADAPRRRPRPPREPGLRTPPPQRRDPQERRDPYERRPARGGRHESYEPYPPYPPYEPPPPRRPAPGGPDGPNSPNGPSGTHHPISRVRYRDSGDEENRTENQTRPRRSPDRDAEAWRYDS